MDADERRALNEFWAEVLTRRDTIDVGDAWVGAIDSFWHHQEVDAPRVEPSPDEPPGYEFLVRKVCTTILTRENGSLIRQTIWRSIVEAKSILDALESFSSVK
ncbi:MAG TPA: hypothetical protein VEI94_07245 [Candidatus Bathyarchaeia archaeon]|nr:hypothetical protein [Candidatus Bathyarchaeia archaeon]